MSRRVAGGCHCGAVRFSAIVPETVELLACNCSICVATGFLHLFVPHDDFELKSGKDQLVSYRFGSGSAEHLFCKTSGIKSFYQPRSHPECWSIHFACLNKGHGIASEVSPFDGRNWEQASRDL